MDPALRRPVLENAVNLFWLEVYDLIIVRSILNRVTALRACGLAAGMIVISPCFTIIDFPEIVTVASPSRI